MCRQVRPIVCDLPRKQIVNDDGWDGGRKSKGGREQRFSNARRDNCQICRV